MARLREQGRSGSTQNDGWLVGQALRQGGLGELAWIHTVVIAARHYSDGPSRPVQVPGRVGPSETGVE